MVEGALPGSRPVGVAPAGRYRCSLVIPTKNGGELFKRVIAGLQAQSCWKDVEFIIVDSQSDDDTVETARAAGAKCLAVAASEFNHGATRDYAISQTTTDRIVLLVQDAVPYDPNTIERLIGALDDDRVAGVYARQIPQADADVITKRNLNIHLTGRLQRDTQIIADARAFAAMAPIDRYLRCNFDNVCSAVRKAVWREEPFGTIGFGEDIDWAERVLKRGYKIVYEPAAAVVHSHDRPLGYEYKRNYICHHKLFSQFGVEMTPTLRSAVSGWYHLTKDDMLYVARTEPRLAAKVALLLKTPVLNFLRILGQFQAVRDVRAGSQRSMRGV